jgi:Tfp pilus assembly protein PilW
MKLRRYFTRPDLAAGHAARSAFTLVEVMIAVSLALLVMGAVMTFLQFGGTYLSGITAQSVINQQAGNAIEFIQSRTRLATSVSTDSSGNVLTLSFDDDPTVDSDSDGKAYNDKDHFEQFKFLGVNGSAVSTNSLVYIPNTAAANKQVLIPAGVRSLPGYNIFSVANQASVIIRLSIADAYIGDHFQGIDIQGTAVPLNRPATTNFVGIIP